MRNLRVRVVSFVFLASLIVLVGSRTALASPPQNDFFANAAPIASLPFSDSGDLNGTSVEPGEFQFFNCSPMQQTVWYRIDASSPVTIKADLNGSGGGVLMNVWQTFPGGGLNNLGFLGCTFVGGSVQITTQPGSTYYIQAGSTFVGSVNLQVNVEAVPPPANDDFVDATVVDSRPFVDPVDLSAATTEPPDEPLNPVPFPQIAGSAWYVYTATASESLTGRVDSFTFSAQPVLAVYTGNSLAGLSLLAARSGFGESVTFSATAGTAYYFQVGRGQLVGGTAPMQFNLFATPPPVANFGFQPFDPSVFDFVGFVDFSFDPGQVGITSWTWQFGDGTTGNVQSPSHRYAKDGDYSVRLAVTTADGRSASSSPQVVQVRTHDVAITKLTVPNSAKAGQTREITAGVRNAYYPENVQFQLLKGVPSGGFQLIGTLTQLMPVQSGNKTTPVTFSYTFSNDDAAIGKVTFEVIAQILGGRDAIPADNTAIALPTRVNP
jgi:PKD repeat protein